MMPGPRLPEQGTLPATAPTGPRAQAALDRLGEAVVDAGREPLIVLDADLRVRTANQAFYSHFLVGPEGVEGCLLSDIGHGEWDVPSLRTLLERVIPADGRVDDFPLEHDFPHPGPRVLLLNARRIDADEGRPHLILLAIEDITERRAAERRAVAHTVELERSNRELEEFASVASHDLQEPLRKIRAFGDRLGAACGPGLGETGRDLLDRMLAAAVRMQALIDALLAFSRISTAARQPVAVDLGRVARDVLVDLEALVERLGATVELGDLPTVRADPMQMHQLLQNLLANALKFHKPGIPPTVRVRALGPSELPGGPRVGFAVEDDGIGFDTRYADKIFRIFERLHARSQYEGTGVGLAICRKIVERHGGSISVISSPGQGATFLVVLPAGQTGNS